MIIAISGKKQSGKNTVASTITYLTRTHARNVGISNISDIFDAIWKNVLDGCPNTSKWTLKSFAHPVKVTASMLTGIPIEDFEKEEVKASYLPKEWDTRIADVKVNGGYIVKRMTVRELLQKIGTDAMRNGVHKDAWVNAMFSSYTPIIPQYSDHTGDASIYPNWIITDCRFTNEANAVKSRNGIIIRVNRNDYIFDGNSKRIIPTKTYVSVDTNTHPSETELDNYPFDYVIDNDGSIDELIEKVKQILLKLKLI